MPRSTSNSKSKNRIVPRDEFSEIMGNVIRVGLADKRIKRWLIDKEIRCPHKPRIGYEGTENLEDIKNDFGATTKCIVCNVTWTFSNTPEGSRWLRETPIRTYIIYSPELPKHMETEGYKNIRQSGYYDFKTNSIVDATDLGNAEYVDNRTAPGS